MKNKGFTLIELLAVIVILAIIALIATPMILGVIDDAKKKSAQTSAQYYVEAVEKSMMTYQMNNNKAIADGTYKVGANGTTLTCDSGDCKTADAKSFNVNVKGDKAKENGTVTIANGQVTGATLTFEGIIAKAVTVNADGSTTIAAS